MTEDTTVCPLCDAAWFGHYEVCDHCDGCPDCCPCTMADLLLKEVPWPIPDNAASWTVRAARIAKQRQEKTP